MKPAESKDGAFRPVNTKRRNCLRDRVRFLLGRRRFAAVALVDRKRFVLWVDYGSDVEHSIDKRDIIGQNSIKLYAPWERVRVESAIAASIRYNRPTKLDGVSVHVALKPFVVRDLTIFPAENGEAFILATKPKKRKDGKNGLRLLEMP